MPFSAFLCFNYFPPDLVVYKSEKLYSFRRASLKMSLFNFLCFFIFIMFLLPNQCQNTGDAKDLLFNKDDSRYLLKDWYNEDGSYLVPELRAYRRLFVDYQLDFASNKLYCRPINALRHPRKQIREAIVKSLLLYRSELGAEEDNAAIPLMVMNILKYPRKEAFSDFIQFMKMFIEAYIPANETELAQQVGNMIDTMETVYTTLDDFVNELINLNKITFLRHGQIFGLNMKHSLKTTINYHGIEITYYFPVKRMKLESFFQHYREDELEFHDLKNLQTPIYFLISNFDNFIMNLFEENRYKFCMMYSQTSKLHVFTRLQPFSIHLTIPRQEIGDKYYQKRMELKVVSSEPPLSARFLTHSRYSLTTSMDCMIQFRILRNIIKDKIHKMKSILHYGLNFANLHGVFFKEESELVMKRDLFPLNQFGDFFGAFIPGLIGLIPGRYEELKSYLSTFTPSVLHFFRESEKGLKQLWEYNKRHELMNFKSWSSKETHFELILNDNAIVFLEWGPAFNFKYFHSVIKKASQNEQKDDRIVLRKILKIFKTFLDFQSLFIDTRFFEELLYYCESNTGTRRNFRRS